MTQQQPRQIKQPLGELIRTAREKAGMTQQAAADAADIYIKSYQRFESGERSPKIESLMKLAIAFGCTLDELVGMPKPKGRRR
jgi:transcriptional regulator with XRE-family HTH domain